MKYFHGEIEAFDGRIIRLRYLTLNGIPDIERYYGKILWIAGGFGPKTKEEWDKISLKDTSPKFKESDAGRYVCVRRESDTPLYGILIEILDREDARVWHPNTTPVSRDGQGTVCIVNINEVIRMGDHVGIFKYPDSFINS